MNIKRIYAIFLRQFFLIRHNKTRLVAIFGWVSLDVILWGFITKYLNNVGQSGFNFVAVFLGVIILWGFMNRIYTGIIMTFLEDMWSRNFFNFFASPLKIGEYILGLISVSLTESILALAAMFLISYLFFAFNIFQLGVLLIPFIGALLIFGIALGIFITGFILRYGPPAEWISWIVPFAISPFAAVFYPIAILPRAMQIISLAVPPSYIFEGLRMIIISGEFSGVLLVKGFVFSFLYLIVSYWFFIHNFKIVLEKGLIARITSENL